MLTMSDILAPMRVLITDDTHPVLLTKLSDAGIQCHVRTDLDYNGILQILGDYDALVVRSKIPIDSSFIDRARHLRCIARVGAGMETIDVAYAESRGIRCLNSPEGNRTAVGEHTVGLLLALFDKICKADNEIRSGLWLREDNRGLEVAGKTVAIIGFGNMGSSFARCLSGFGCKILAYDKYKTGYATDYVAEVSLQQCFEQADVVSFHVPLTAETRYYADSRFLDSFAKNIYLINTSRGAVVQTSALVEALKSGKVAGAALDVLEYENMVKDSLTFGDMSEEMQYLVQCQNVVLTPHVAGWTVESKVKLASVLADKIIDTLKINNI